MPAAAVDSQMGIVRSVKALRTRIEAWRTAGLSVGFAPTMGGLHDGHLSLIRRSNSVADRTVASIFVNPAQFAPGEDLAAYPRQEARDLDMLQQAGCHLAFLPTAAEMYPAGFETSVNVGAVGRDLCGASRPHFFGGVATVVCKLFNQVRPDVAIFGEKDFQQLLVIRRMVRDLNMPVDILGAPIVREADGLAMSSRNVYLSADERRIAGRLNKAIAHAAERLESGAAVADAIGDAAAFLQQAGVGKIDYLEVRSADALDLQGPGPVETPSRVFVAAIIGKTRLIDNWPVAVAPAGQ